MVRLVQPRRSIQHEHRHVGLLGGGPGEGGPVHAAHLPKARRIDQQKRADVLRHEPLGRARHGLDGRDLASLDQIEEGGLARVDRSDDSEAGVRFLFNLEREPVPIQCLKQVANIGQPGWQWGHLGYHLVVWSKGECSTEGQVRQPATGLAVGRTAVNRLCWALRAPAAVRWAHLASSRR